ncbi:hypothetical protein CO007_05895 [Candidatus Roizmanbacteria bacterium CG_4_8_14_3_um_filter_36_10]|uniref:SpoVT-AbrB domain-containing protein n=3 Tax=Candidatus Roizmaniibacteriota TaxID=1752723 RepID=A0A2M8KKY3_9BACT|nr:MAG: hypothetical protein COV86_02495 [Candidatus Roizmanbacteria bacterium CG11_big_fil_rev_8_21_14_0_20_35_14]PJA52757.1 MAG: hypothetical protein CO166_04355 [Candidatus Roizmanbacteria bacterium CG_4_9_14_3_um_filter_36_11]PJC81189.1 MAG: hypothetical protein CO007_05895 [Candidatus Roizmanbacteria bacterium CG_4_8_14_3_um_filter_36_10]PJE60579.1 MAG: hypothetical protein COU86_03465 [Candidatus Roizmanbacteria bacterium CG10_big_fil_rev_8_21_14_0_10_36_26]
MQITTNQQEEWLKILTKGMVTIPKSWRKELGIEEGKMVKAKKIANQIIIEPMEKPVSYRTYSQKELQQFLKDDRLPKKLEKKLAKVLK